jgi:hypothetical protein
MTLIRLSDIVKLRDVIAPVLAQVESSLSGIGE